MPSRGYPMRKKVSASNLLNTSTSARMSARQNAFSNFRARRLRTRDQQVSAPDRHCRVAQPASGLEFRCRPSMRSKRELGSKAATVIHAANAESALPGMERIFEHFRFVAKATSVPKLQRIAWAFHL